MPESTTIFQLRQRIEGIDQIPANEQCLSHFHQAVRDLLGDMLDHIEKMEKILGVSHA